MKSTTSTKTAQLCGRVFAFHGLSCRRQEQWTRILMGRGASVARSWCSVSTQIHVVADYWVDATPTASNVVIVTEFWLRRVLSERQWPSPDEHPLFTPPAALGPLRLVYPMDYDHTLVHEAAQEMHVLLPCSPENQVEDAVPLWPYVVAYLSQPTRTTRELCDVIQLITGDVRHPPNCLAFALDELLSSAEKDAFFASVLPTMKRLVLELSSLFPRPFRLLTPFDPPSAAVSSREIRSSSLDLTRSQLLALLSCAFLGLFPAQHHAPKGVDFPYFNMEQMLSAPRAMKDLVLLKAHKIRTILEYFMRIVPRFQRDPDTLRSQIVTFTRVAVFVPPPSEQQTLLGRLTDATSIVGMCDVRIESHALIEDLDAHVQIDFANKYAGGGVMNAGAVQEEIRFILSPELLVACLVFARLDPHEGFVIHGSERFSNYKGYGGSFRFDGASPVDATPFGLQTPHRRQSVVVGIDAISYGNNARAQYTRRCIQRDLVKALVGFAYPEPETHAWPIATGNWGCGVFRGDPELKFLIQWLAASLAARPHLVYVMFERDGDLQHKIEALLCVCRRVADRRELTKWVTEFLWGLEADMLPEGNGRAASRRREGERRHHGGAGPRVSVLDQAMAFMKRQAATKSDVGREEGSLSPPAAVSVADGLSETFVAPPPSAPPPVPSPGLPSTERSTSSPRSRGAGGGPMLKQPKLTSFWK